jgi:signal transduction histidine kinase
MLTQLSKKPPMNAQPSATAEPPSPLPDRQLRRFILFFHFVFIGGLAVSLAMRWRRPDNVFGWTDIVLLGLVVIQVALYLWLFAIPSQTGRWPHKGALAFYFVASALVFFAECHLERAFQWAIGAYMGQLLALPVRVALPATAALFIGFFLSAFGWSGLTRLSAWEWITLTGGLVAWTGLALFLHRALATSAERGKLILELEAAKRELELARERDAELAVLQERERLARDLHDSLGHSLVTLTVQLEAAQRLAASDPARAAALLVEMQKLTRSSMEDLRRSLANLRAAGLGDRPLTEALRTLCDDARRRSDTNLECALAEGANQLPPRVAEAVWRVAQESLMNAEKHARASRIQVDLKLDPKEVILLVRDDGTGLPPGAEAKPGHYGLRGLRERVEGLGGTFTGRSPENMGTLIEARIPLIA